MLTVIAALLVAGQNQPIADWTRKQVDDLARHAGFERAKWAYDSSDMTWNLGTKNGSGMILEATLDVSPRQSRSEEDLSFREKIAAAGREVWSTRGLQWRVAVIDYSDRSKRKGKLVSGNSDVSAWLESRFIRGRVRLRSTQERGYVEKDCRNTIQFGKNFGEVMSVRFRAK